MPIRDIVLKTNRKQCRGGERGSGISALIAQHNDDDDDDEGGDKVHLAALMVVAVEYVEGFSAER